MNASAEGLLRDVELADGVRRLIAPNPSVMTGPGTNTYVLGNSQFAVIDPGPLIDEHVAEIQRHCGDALRWILVTHTHSDHSPAAADLARLSGAELLGRAPPAGAHQDPTFTPDRRLRDGEQLQIDDDIVTVIATPGHASNHLCFHHHRLNWVFTGDHVIDGSTVVIDPPDGDMSDYIASLRKVRAADPAAIAPGHGDLIHDPHAAIDWIIEHRLAREATVFAALSERPGSSSMALVPFAYAEIDERLYRLAERSLLAHLLKLERDGRAVREDGRWSAV